MVMALAAAQQEAYSVAGSTVENNLAAAPVGLFIQFGAGATGQIKFDFQKGGPATVSFAPGAHSDISALTIDLTSGKWTFNNQSGTLTAGQLTAARNSVANLRNQAETVAQLLNLFPGVTIPVTW